jgi:hypothetical protein
VTIVEPESPAWTEFSIVSFGLYITLNKGISVVQISLETLVITVSKESSIYSKIQLMNEIPSQFNQIHVLYKDH